MQIHPKQDVHDSLGFFQYFSLWQCVKTAQVPIQSKPNMLDPWFKPRGDTTAQPTILRTGVSYAENTGLSHIFYHFLNQFSLPPSVLSHSNSNCPAPHFSNRHLTKIKSKQRYIKAVCAHAPRQSGNDYSRMPWGLKRRHGLATQENLWHRTAQCEFFSWWRYGTWLHKHSCGKPNARFLLVATFQGNHEVEVTSAAWMFANRKLTALHCDMLACLPTESRVVK